MKRNLLTWALALGLVLGGVGLAQTSRAADEAAPAPAATKTSAPKHHHHKKHSSKKAVSTDKSASAEQPAK